MYQTNNSIVSREHHLRYHAPLANSDNLVSSVVIR